MNGTDHPTPTGAESRSGISAKATGDEYGISLRELLRIIGKRLLIIGLVAAVLTGAAVGLSLAQTPIYETSIEILVGQERGITETPNDAMGLQQLTMTMAEGVSSRRVTEAVIQQQRLRISPDFLEANMSVEQVGSTQFIRVYYRDSDPERAQRIANAIGDVYSKQISEVSSSANAITATVWERAVVTDEPVSPNPVRNGLMALVIGLMLGVGLALLIEYLDDSWRSAEEMEEISGVPTFGVIPEFKAYKAGRGGDSEQFTPKARVTPGAEGDEPR